MKLVIPSTFLLFLKFLEIYYLNELLSKMVLARNDKEMIIIP